MHDAIVIGAGLSGLVCARRLVDAGLDAIVLEARDRVGGRLHSGRVGDAVVDLGGQWMSVDQPRLLALAGELGVASLPQPRAGRPLLDDDGRQQGWLARAGTLFAQLAAVRRIQRAMRAIPADDPARAPRAAELDAIRLGPWLAGTIENPVARARIALHAELVFATELADLSLLAYLARLGTTGGFAPRGPDLPGGGRDHRFVGGAQLLALRLAERLGDRVHLGTAVDEIAAGHDLAARPSSAVAAGLAIAARQGVAASQGVAARQGVAASQGVSAALAAGADADALIVRSSDSRSWHARHVVLALPPRLAARIAAPLPATLRQHAAAMRGGAVVKVFAAYDRAFWRDAGLSGEAYCPHGTLRAVVDATPPDSATAVLLGFVVGAAAEAWHTRAPDERRAEILASLASLFDGPPPIDYLEADWAIDPHAAGCVAVTPPGALAAGTTWRTPHGRLHLAGTETALRWPGYMEGAIEAGERAASEVILRPA